MEKNDTQVYTLLLKSTSIKLNSYSLKKTERVLSADELTLLRIEYVKQILYGYIISETVNKV